MEHSEPKNTILIVDDEELNISVLRNILSDTYNVKTAKSGNDALAIAEDDPPDLILLDVLMPGMDGYETLTALKNDEKTRRIPVIFITGLDTTEDEKKGLEMEAADYIGKPFSKSIVKLRVKNQMQIVNQIKTIESLSLIDQLTGIPNRRNLDNRLAMEWARAFREKQHVSLMMMDVDKFKVFNDTYGHQVGDTVLQLVAGTFESALKRKSDFAARYGGEEFCVLLPNTSLEGALETAERVRKGVERLVIPCGGGKTTSVTISIGVHTFIPQEDEDITAMIAKADAALYAAKEAGRNRVCAFDGQTLKPKEKNTPPDNATDINNTAKPDNATKTDDSAKPAGTAAQAEKQQVGTAAQAGTLPAGKDNAGAIQRIGETEGINIEMALSNFKDMEDSYAGTVELFCSRLPEVISDMDNALASGNIEAFKISVHSVKSMLSTVGAMGASRKAAKLENAAAAADADYCKENYPPLRETLSKLMTDLETAIAGPSVPPASARVCPPERRRIIHVDDVQYTLVSLNDRLKEHFEIYPALSHIILFDILENIIPDLILLDVKMPGMDGYQIIAKLKETPRFADIPVIFLTGVNDEESIAKCKALGAVDVITKPVSDAELISRISKAVES